MNRLRLGCVRLWLAPLCADGGRGLSLARPGDYDG